MRPAPRPWPEPPAARRERSRATRTATRPAPASRAALEASENGALADAVVLRHAARRPRRGDRRRPGVAAAAGDEGGLPAQPHRALARRRGDAPCSTPPSRSPPARPSASAATSRPAPGRAAATGRAPADAWGALLQSTPRDVAGACSGRCCSTSTAATPRRCASASPRVLPAWSAADPLYPYVLGHHAFGLEESRPLCRGRGGRPPRRGRHGARALGDPRRRPCHGDAGPARRGRRLDGDLAAVLGRGQRLCRAPRLARGAVRARGAATIAKRARGVRRSTCDAEANEITLQRVDAAVAALAAGACTAPRSATAGSGSSPAGRWPTRPRPAARPSTTCTRCIALLGAGERDAAGALDERVARQRRCAAAPGTARSRAIVAAPLMQGLLAFARRPLRRRRRGCSSRCAAPPARVSAAAMRSAT